MIITVFFFLAFESACQNHCALTVYYDHYCICRHSISHDKRLKMMYSLPKNLWSSFQARLHQSSASEGFISVIRSVCVCVLRVSFSVKPQADLIRLSEHSACVCVCLRVSPHPLNYEPLWQHRCASTTGAAGALLHEASVCVCVCEAHLCSSISFISRSSRVSRQDSQRDVRSLTQRIRVFLILQLVYMF